MEENVKKALEFANYQQTLTIQRKVLKEKVEAKLTFGHNGGIFKITHSLIAFVQMLIDRGRVSGVPLVDENYNPILIDNLEEFRDEMLDRYFSSVQDYYEKYQDLKKHRSVEKLVDL